MISPRASSARTRAGTTLKMLRATVGVSVRHLARIALLLVGVALHSVARAADPASGPITVSLHSESSDLSYDALARALTEELGESTVTADEGAAARGVLTVTYRPRTKELVVSYSHPARGTVTRVVPAPDRVNDVAELAALIAGNLIRDQAAEFLPRAKLIAPVPVTIANLPPATSVSPLETPPPDEPARASPVRWRANAALFYPLATNAHFPELETNLDINLLYGHIGSLDGLELGMVSRVDGDAQGLQASKLTNLVRGQVRAAQFSLLFNHGRSVDGVQVALVNRADQAMQGVQLGALNLAGSLSQGAQLAVSHSAGNLDGVQLGLINVAKRVRGVQIGLVNIADDVEGAPIGLVNVSKTGSVHPLAWSSNTTYANLGVKFAMRYTYTMLSGAMHHDGGHDLYGGGFTIGASIPVTKKITTEIDLQALHLFADSSCTTQSSAERSYYPVPEDPWPAVGPCTEQAAAVPAYGSGAPRPRPANEFTSATYRAYDQSLAKLRALIRFELYSHLSLFIGTGVTGRVTYPVVNGDTQVTFRLLSEFFGGVQL